MKKDKISIYLARNILAVFIITVIAMAFSIMDYYQCDFAEGLQRIFIYNGITTLYLLILCSLNYCIFEFFKVLTDAYDQLTSVKSAIAFIIIALLCKILPIHSLFQYNFCFLLLLVTVRIIKQLYKKRSQV